MEQTQLLNIFGAKYSKDGKKVILVLVAGDGENRRYYNAVVHLDKQHKVMGEVVKGELGSYAMFSVRMLDETPQTVKSDPLPF